MIRPTKFNHPDQTVVNLATLMLRKLRKSRIVDFSQLYEFSGKSVKGGEFLFLPALNFLYIVGLVEYRSKTDIIEYVGANETV